MLLLSVLVAEPLEPELLPGVAVWLLLLVILTLLPLLCPWPEHLTEVLETVVVPVAVFVVLDVTVFIQLPDVVTVV